MGYFMSRMTKKTMHLNLLMENGLKERMDERKGGAAMFDHFTYLSVFYRNENIN